MAEAETAPGEIRVPELRTGAARIRFVGWLVPVRARIISGERIAELVVEGINFHVEAASEGILVDRQAAAGDFVRVGDLLGTMRES